MGGLILRATFPLIKEYKAKMKNFISFSTPHLGYSSNSSYLIKYGIWLLKKFQTITSLDQLSVSDSK